MRAASLLAVAGVLLLIGCGKDSNGPGGERRDRGNATKLEGRLLYRRDGGLAGVSDELTLEPDGRGTLSRRLSGRRSVMLRPAERQDVARALAAVDLTELDDEYKPSEPVPDGFGESVMYDGETVSVQTGGEEPDELARLTSTLSGLIERYSPKR